jgi:hypothetical protein
MSDPVVLPGWHAVLAWPAPAPVLGAGPDVVADAVSPWRPVYVATPYTNRVKDAKGAWCWARSQLLARESAGAAADLLGVGLSAIAPIALADAMIGVRGAGPKGIDPLAVGLWDAWCAPLLRACSAVWVPDLPGWALSRGVLIEVEAALRDGKQVFVEAAALPVAA